MPHPSDDEVTTVTVNHDPDTLTYLRRQMDKEMRIELRSLRDEVNEIQMILKDQQVYREQYDEAIKTAAKLVNAGIAVRYMLVAAIAMLSMIGGIQVAYETLRKWMGTP